MVSQPTSFAPTRPRHGAAHPGLIVFGTTHSLLDQQEASTLLERFAARNGHVRKRPRRP